jgi:Tfp pilus assembly protein PilO
MGLLLEILVVIVALFVIIKLAKYALALRGENKRIEKVDLARSKVEARKEYLKRRAELKGELEELRKMVKEEKEESKDGKAN